ncbi:hypothetical protein E8D34_15770 [Nocardioides sp. GY 10113]|uniref:hypothetical protein n=1 Tax=Nocardioides sp. GY 10113 TaxID=2569761 RepID=UPI0010A7A57D|nr:hypothetical protein [Nocardioides sp. GY 10113]TIC83580.1 hypothetical protein E8D34_15770 [Nocardioides sp. GY 10113]
MTALRVRHRGAEVAVRLVARRSPETLLLYLDTPRDRGWDFVMSYSNEIEDAEQAWVYSRSAWKGEGGTTCVPRDFVRTRTVTRVLISRHCLGGARKIRVKARSFPNGQAEQVLIDRTAWTPFVRRPRR